MPTPLARPSHSRVDARDFVCPFLTVRAQALSSRFSPKSDVWSLAVLAWECFQPGVLPYPEVTDDDVLIVMVHDGLRLARPDACPLIVWSELLSCWDATPDARPTSSELCERVRCLRALVAQSDARGKPLPTCTVAQVIDAVGTLGTPGRHTDAERAQLNSARHASVADAVDGPCLIADAASFKAAALLWLAAEFVRAVASAPEVGIDPALVAEDFRVRFKDEEAALIRMAREAPPPPAPPLATLPASCPPSTVFVLSSSSPSSPSQPRSRSVVITKPTADSKFGIDLHRLTEKHQHYHSSFRPYLRKGLVVTAGDDFERGLWRANGLGIGDLLTAINGIAVDGDSAMAAAMLRSIPAGVPTTFDVCHSAATQTADQLISGFRNVAF